MKIFSKKRLIVILMIISLLVAYPSCRSQNVEVHMFADLVECKAMASTSSNNSHIAIFDSPDEDKYLDKLPYTDFFAFSYASEELQFELFAYEFANQGDAKQYYKNVTGKDYQGTITFSDVEGMIYYRRIVVKDNMAFTVYAEPSEAKNVIKFINERFSIKVV